ncbi:SH3 domain-containing protein [Rhizobium sp. AN80A]|uniref:SH3 domain-containing protein n=1 Tax=Rhizobium sp. AN80A TaxID=3040673 RepID=UPI0024B32BE2|nr:SH3 domain-containing protein [Rhizobium sp. AN80A]
MKTTLMKITAVAALLLAPVAAQAAEGFATANVNMRAGPSTQYPAVTVIPAGESVQIYGCLADVPWCDVEFYNGRGWVAGRYVQALYQQRRVYVDPQYYRPLGIPTVVFSVGNYWDRYYRDRSFYGQRERWRRNPVYDRPAAVRPPPGPEFGNPGYNNGRPRPGYDNDRPRPGFDNDRPRPGFDNNRPRPGFDAGPGRQPDFDRGPGRGPDFGRGPDPRQDPRQDNDGRPPRFDGRAGMPGQPGQPGQPGRRGEGGHGGQGGQGGQAGQPGQPGQPGFDRGPDRRRDQDRRPPVCQPGDPNCGQNPQ